MLHRLLATAGELEIRTDRDVGARRTGESRDLGQDLVGAVVLLQALINVAEGHQRERMVRIEMQARGADR